MAEPFASSSKRTSRSSWASEPSLRRPLGLGDVDDRQGTAIPGPAAGAAGVPGDVDAVPLRADGGAVRPLQRAAVAVLVEGVQEGDDLLRPRLHVELHQGAAVLLAAAVCPGVVIE